MTQITPYTIETSEEELNDLKQRLVMTRWPDKELFVNLLLALTP